MSVNYYKILFLIVLVLILNSCDRTRNDPGWDYFPDMFYSTAYESYTSNPNFKDGLTMRTPVPGTVPRDFTPFNYTIDAESRVLAGVELMNPIPLTDEAVVRGKNSFTVFCAGCHGVSGTGDGYLYTSGLYPLKPRTLTGDVAINLKDGEIFHSITLGFGSMGAHGSQIRSEERWMLIHYIRKLQEEAQVATKGINNLK